MHYMELVYSNFLHSFQHIIRTDCQTDKLRVQQRYMLLKYETPTTIYRYCLLVSRTSQYFIEISKLCTIRQKLSGCFSFQTTVGA